MSAFSFLFYDRRLVIESVLICFQWMSHLVRRAALSIFSLTFIFQHCFFMWTIQQQTHIHTLGRRMETVFYSFAPCCPLFLFLSAFLFILISLALFSLSFPSLLSRWGHATITFAVLKKRWLDRFNATGASLVVWSSHFLSTSAFVFMWACLLYVHLNVLYMYVCVVI